MASSEENGVLRLRDWFGLSCWPVYVYDRTFPVAGRSWEGEGQPHNAAWLVRTGTATVTTPRRAATARAGEWIIPPRGAHRTRFDERASILSVRYYAVWPYGRQLIDPTECVVLARERSQTLTRLATRLERFAARVFTRADTGMEFKRADAAQYLELNRHFFGWLAELATRLEEAGQPPSTPARADERVLRAARWLNTIPLDEPWSPAELARRAGLSAVQLNRLFVAAFETTPKRYYEERRKRAAAHLLGEQRRPVKEAALALGFSSSCYFTAWFRERFGAAPRAWTKAREAGRPLTARPRTPS